MFGKRLLVVDSDARNLRVLERKLSDAGFHVRTARRADEALEMAATARPDVILSEFSAPNIDGPWLCQKLRADERTEACGIVILSRDGSMDAKQAALDAGCDEYLHKPIFVREILLHLSNLISRLSRRDTPSSFSGALSRLSVADLLQLMEASRKTCIVNLRTDPERSGGFSLTESEGAICFRQGQVIAAYLEGLRGAPAIYRMLLWTDGAFDIDFSDMDQATELEASTQALLLEGMRRMDEWTRALEVLGSPTVKLGMVPGCDLRSAPEVLMAVLPFLDGKHTLLDALDAANLEDETIALNGIARLVAEGLLETEEGKPPIPLTRLKEPKPRSDSKESWWNDMMDLV